MNWETLEVLAEDRPATGEEIRRAISISNGRLPELCRQQGNYCQMDSDFSGIIRYSAEELEFFSHLSDSDETVIN